MSRPKIDYDILPYVDNNEQVTLRKVNALTGATTDYDSILAVPNAITETVIDPSGVQTVVQRTDWVLRTKDLRGHSDMLVPDRDDRIVSTSDVWSGTYVIFSANQEVVGSQYRCQTQKLIS